jgi:hypothetical protein
MRPIRTCEETDSKLFQAPEPVMSDLAQRELGSFINGLCSDGAATLRFSTIQRFVSGTIVSCVAVGRLSNAADPRKAYIYGRFVWSWELDTRAPANFSSLRLPDEAARVRPWNWSRTVPFTGMERFPHAFEWHKRIRNRFHDGLFALLLDDTRK